MNPQNKKTVPKWFRSTRTLCTDNKLRSRKTVNSKKSSYFIIAVLDEKLDYLDEHHPEMETVDYHPDKQQVL